MRTVRGFGVDVFSCSSLASAYKGPMRTPCYPKGPIPQIIKVIPNTETLLSTIKVHRTLWTSMVQNRAAPSNQESKGRFRVRSLGLSSVYTDLEVRV